MISFDRIKVRCPKCNKLVCTMDVEANPKGIHFWCARCKEDFDIIENKSSRSQ